MAKKTKTEALETRNLILDAAENVFSEKGVSRTSLNDIAQAAGVTRGAIYWHFKNKADLFSAMLKRVTLPMDDFLEQHSPHPNEPILTVILQRALHIVRLLIQDPRTQRVFDIVIHKAELVDDMHPIRNEHMECRQDCLSRIENEFHQAISKGELPSTINPAHAAIGFHSLIDGLFCNWVLNPQSFNLIEQAELALNCYLKGLQQQSLQTPNNRNASTMNISG